MLQALFQSVETNKQKLILEKDNPSPQNKVRCCENNIDEIKKDELWKK